MNTSDSNKSEEILTQEEKIEALEKRQKVLMLACALNTIGIVLLSIAGSRRRDITVVPVQTV